MKGAINAVLSGACAIINGFIKETESGVPACAYWPAGASEGTEVEDFHACDRFVMKKTNFSGVYVGIEDFRSKHGHNFIGDYNYYVMPHEVYLAVMKEIPYYVGVYCPIEDTKFLTCMTPPRRRDRSRPVSEVLLMMFRSAARENLKGARKNGREKETD